MTKALLRCCTAGLLMVPSVFAQDIDPFPKPITQNGEPIHVNVAEFASIPGAGGEAARMMLLVNEPGTRRLFVNDMRGPLYTVSYDGRFVHLDGAFCDPKPLQAEPQIWVGGGGERKTLRHERGVWARCC